MNHLVNSELNKRNKFLLLIITSVVFWNLSGCSSKPPGNSDAQARTVKTIRKHSNPEVAHILKEEEWWLPHFAKLLSVLRNAPGNNLRVSYYTVDKAKVDLYLQLSDERLVLGGNLPSQAITIINRDGSIDGGILFAIRDTNFDGRPDQVKHFDKDGKRLKDFSSHFRKTIDDYLIVDENYEFDQTRITWALSIGYFVRKHLKESPPN